VREFFATKKGKLLLAAVALLAGTMLFSARSGGLATLPEKALSLVLYPFQKAAQELSDSFTEFAGVFFDARENYTENKELREEITRLREQLVEYQSLESENSRLREMLEIKQESPQLTLLDAAVIARSPSDRFAGFTIDKGSIDGVSLYDPVMTKEGLVGYIGQLSTASAQVVTLLSPACNVGASASDTGDSGNVTGTLELAEEGLARMELIAKDATLQAGSLLITSGLTGSFPKGLLIGTVESVQLEDSGISKWAAVRPTADITGATTVFVITDFPGKGGSDETTEQSDDTVFTVPAAGSGE
jgi:rod shape-determining protein MreC